MKKIKICKPTIVTNAKTCNKCGLVKLLDEFSKGKNICKVCKNKYNKEYYKENKEELIEYQKEYNELNKEELIEKRKEYYEENKDECLKRQKEYAEKNKNSIAEYQKEYRKEYEQRSEVKKRRREREKLRRQNDSVYKIIHSLRKGMLNAVKSCGAIKCKHTKDFIGCTIYEYLQYLQLTALANGYDDFNIENFDGKEYHLDHIIPLAAWNMKCKYHQQLGFHGSNTQILTAEENLRKGDKILE